MRAFIRLPAIAATLAMLSACATTTTYPSESVYTRAETMQSASVDRCRVLDVRHISVGATPNRASRYGRPAMQMEETIGAALGAGLGAALGSQVGSGTGREVAVALGTALGSAAGQQAGSRMAQTRQRQAGIEYSVLESSGRELVIAQNHNPGDRIVPAGGSCRLVRGGEGLRVMPADHLPGQVHRPARTVFY